MATGERKRKTTKAPECASRQHQDCLNGPENGGSCTCECHDAAAAQQLSVQCLYGEHAACPHGSSQKSSSPCFCVCHIKASSPNANAGRTRACVRDDHAACLAPQACSCWCHSLSSRPGPILPTPATGGHTTGPVFTNKTNNLPPIPGNTPITAVIQDLRQQVATLQAEKDLLLEQTTNLNARLTALEERIAPSGRVRKRIDGN